MIGAFLAFCPLPPLISSPFRLRAPVRPMTLRPLFPQSGFRRTSSPATHQRTPDRRGGVTFRTLGARRGGAKGTVWRPLTGARPRADSRENIFRQKPWRRFFARPGRLLAGWDDPTWRRPGPFVRGGSSDLARSAQGVMSADFSDLKGGTSKNVSCSRLGAARMPGRGIFAASPISIGRDAFVDWLRLAQWAGRRGGKGKKDVSTAMCSRADDRICQGLGPAVASGGGGAAGFDAAVSGQGGRYVPGWQRPIGRRAILHQQFPWEPRNPLCGYARNCRRIPGGRPDAGDRLAPTDRPGAADYRLSGGHANGLFVPWDYPSPDPPADPDAWKASKTMAIVLDPFLGRLEGSAYSTCAPGSHPS